MDHNKFPVEQKLVAALAACACGIMTFGMMDAVMKGLSLEIGVYNALFWRCLASALLASALFLIFPSPFPSRKLLRIHVLRGTITVVMGYCFFYALVRLPMAETVAISFIAPILALWLAAIWLKEQISGRSIIASISGLGGVLVIAAGRWESGSLDQRALEGIIAIIFSAILYAVNLILQRRQAQMASGVEITLFQNLVIVFWLALLLPFYGHIPQEPLHWGLIGTGAVLAVVSLLLLSWGYARAEAQSLMPVEYSMFIWAVLLGWYFFDEALDWSVLAGAVLIVAGCLVIIPRRKALVPDIAAAP